MRATLDEPKVVVSAAVEPDQRHELERLAREGDRTLSQQVRIAVREYLAHQHTVVFTEATAGVVGDGTRRSRR